LPDTPPQSVPGGDVPKVSRGDVVGQMARRKAKIQAVKTAFRAGSYIAGSWIQESICEGCGTLFPQWRCPKSRFCSRLCSGRNDNLSPEERAAHAVARAKEYNATQRPKPNPKPIQWSDRLCVECGKVFSFPRSKVLCSDGCQKARTSRTAVAARIKDRTRLVKCPGCDVTFNPAERKHSKKFCSAECGNKECRRRLVSRRRARLAGVRVEFVNPTVVFDADFWKCYLCGVDTPRSLQGDGRASDAPTMDHVIPLARGGAHSYANIRCACRQCNSKKSDAIWSRGEVPAWREGRRILDHGLIVRSTVFGVGAHNREMREESPNGRT
jgi:5-methylcytosine-specific restriction endonuclease McrA